MPLPFLQPVTDLPRTSPGNRLAPGAEDRLDLFRERANPLPARDALAGGGQA